MRAIEIRRLTNRSRGFYALIGPFLARREIAAELGGPVWDDDGLTWFVAISGGKVAGFAALSQDGEKAHLRHSYVLPAHRRSGVYRQLFDARMGAVRAPATVRSVVRAEAARVFRANGFTEAKRTKNYCTMERRVP